MVWSLDGRSQKVDSTVARQTAGAASLDGALLTVHAVAARVLTDHRFLGLVLLHERHLAFIMCKLEAKPRQHVALPPAQATNALLDLINLARHAAEPWNDITRSVGHGGTVTGLAFH